MNAGKRDNLQICTSFESTRDFQLLGVFDKVREPVLSLSDKDN